MINIITRATIIQYSEIYPKAKTALDLWELIFKKHTFSDFQELKAVYGNASVVSNNRVIFNIKGNDFRLIVMMNFKTKIPSAYVIWFGTHAEYDEIDAATVKYRANI